MTPPISSTNSKKDLRMADSTRIGVLVHSIGDFIYPLCRGITAIAEQQGIDVVYFSLSALLDEESENNPVQMIQFPTLA